MREFYAKTGKGVNPDSLPSGGDGNGSGDGATIGGGAIAAIVVAALLGVVAAVAAVYVYKRRSSENQATSSTTENLKSMRASMSGVSIELNATTTSEP